MALTDVKQSRQATGFSLVERLRTAAADLLSGEHAKTQRMAGAAFANPVAARSAVGRLCGDGLKDRFHVFPGRR